MSNSSIYEKKNIKIKIKTTNLSEFIINRLILMQKIKNEGHSFSSSIGIYLGIFVKDKKKALFYRYQHNEQSPLTFTHFKHTKIDYDI